jgi:hypothetical protein
MHPKECSHSCLQVLLSYARKGFEDQVEHADQLRRP